MPVVRMQFPASISVTNLNGINGFTITGFPASSEGGYCVSKAGDVNGDGIADLVVGARSAFSQGSGKVGYDNRYRVHHWINSN